MRNFMMAIVQGGWRGVCAQSLQAGRGLSGGIAVTLGCTKRSIALRFFGVFLAVALAACTLELPSPVSASVAQYMKGAPVRAWALTEKQAGSLTEWFKQRQSGWSPSYASYVPHVLVRLGHADGKESSINVLASGLIVVVSKEGQFTQSFEANVVGELLAIIGANGG